MTEQKNYRDYLSQVGEMMTQAMPGLDRDRDDLADVEAEIHRLKTQLANAEERRETLAERYRRNRGVFMEMWNTWKDELVAMRPGPAPMPFIPDSSSGLGRGALDAESLGSSPRSGAK